MNFSSNRYGALDHLFDLDMAMTTNGYSNTGSNNPSSMSYSPEAASLLGTSVYNPTGVARGGSTELSSATNHGAFHHHSIGNTQHHQSLLTTTTAQTSNYNSSSAASSPYIPAGGQYFGTNNSGNNLNARGMSPFGGNGQSTSAAAATAANNTTLRQMAASYEPIPMRQQQQQAAANQTHQRHQNDHERSPLEELLLMGTSSFMSPVSAPANSFDPLTLHHDSFFGRTSAPVPQQQPSNTAAMNYQEEEWMREINLTVPSLSLEPLSGAEIAIRIRACTQDVLRRYIPCVDFLVQCQQELRKGLAVAQPKQSGRRYRHSAMTPRQFWQTYIEQLPNRFYMTNERRMESVPLQEAVQGLHKLRTDAKTAVNQGCEAVKNTFLGGMKEGESWGLRKWLSKNGNALRTCTDLECILRACKELDKSKETTKKLAAFLRPLAKETLDRLKKDVPPSYQERSTAHPYLPFFHRLEGALRNMSQFDPEDDGVICLDDSDDDDEPVIVVPVPTKRKPAARKRKVPVETHTIDTTTTSPPKKRVFDDGAITAILAEAAKQDDHVATGATATTEPDEGSSSGESDVDSVIQIVAQAVRDDDNFGVTRTDNGWRCTNCQHRNLTTADDSCAGCGEPSYNTELLGALFSPTFGDDLDMNSVDKSSDGYADPIESKPKKSKKKRQSSGVNESSHRFPIQASQDEIAEALGTAQSLASKAERLADMFENMVEADQPVQMIRARKSESLWDDLYSTALRIFSDLLRQPNAVHFVEPVNEFELMKAGHPPYTSVVKNPLCFRDILATLVDLDHMNENHAGCYKWLNGILPRRGLSNWNMWRGSDLLQAVDLVFLNSLAYGKICGEGRSRNRSRTNDLRKQLWNQIQETVNACIDDPERKRQCTPTRRSETSGFVVEKRKGR